MGIFFNKNTVITELIFNKHTFDIKIHGVEENKFYERFSCYKYSITCLDGDVSTEELTKSLHPLTHSKLLLIVENKYN